ncbi:AP-3 complex subunit beta [Basidiobolus ranarum]|uniref:AP complex subunit beta n=1 Tax=Basidiobolus ranarum TaxID=34480 RepID=A0ABR2VQF9_9FUNG
MISKGRDVSEFFPDVVKNVASSNLEIRKLVYIYLLRYAEQEPDLALLSVNTFQKDLSDQNQVIRAMALRVMSGIRVPVISPIVMLAIKKCVTDLSAYVRKTAAHAIPKCYSLDPSQKENLIEILEVLLKDKSAFTIGSVIMAFNELCPDRFDLIHKNYRKLCYMLIDTDEWGQIAILRLLLRYARAHFLDPNRYIKVSKPKTKKDSSFYSEDDDSADSEDHEDVVDYDLEFLLKSSAPLMQSRNSGVVMAVCSLYYHAAPAMEVFKVGKPLVRLLRTHPEIQYVVLTNIATMAHEKPEIFEPYLQQFFVRSTDPAFVRNLKLRILTSLANESNVSTLLRELQDYVKSSNKEFVKAAIQAIGRCATTIPEIADNCIRGLMNLISYRSDAVVAESVVVTRRLLQSRPNDNASMIIRLVKSLDNIKVPEARASIFWLVGQYCHNLEKVAPDTLRKGAKTFVEESEFVKLQIITLAAKLMCALPTTPKMNLLYKYVFTLARYDMNYDVRDRARFLKALMSNAGGENTEQDDSLRKHAEEILLCEKPAPVTENPLAGRDKYAIGSMSMVLNSSVFGYESLPDWPSVQPDPSLRDTQDDISAKATNFVNPSRNTPANRSEDYGLDAFYDSEEESGDGDTEEEEEEEEDDDESEEDSEESEDDDDESEEASEEASEESSSESDQDESGNLIRK